MPGLNRVHSHPVSPLVGDTPLVRIGSPFTAPGCGFWAKLEGANPGGIKDRPALFMVDRA
ncbi:MAG: pyridoxal-5'-phosphate-dependent protein subunit beta, partial [Mycobacteriales bacterium]